MEQPDKWIVIQIGEENPLYKVLVAWYGGYLGEDRWNGNRQVQKRGAYRPAHSDFRLLFSQVANHHNERPCQSI